jgi:fucose 4-O-acetylase-like acetyltransferase
MSVVTDPTTPPGAGAVRTPEPQQPAPREPFWDNVRFVAIALVVVGHSIETFALSDTMAAVYVVIYAFHMPLFAFVCGRFASATAGRPGSAAKLLSQIVVPYVVFNVIWFTLRVLVEGHARLDLATPYWHLWFLVALAVWRLLLPAIATLRYPVLMSVGVSVVAGYVHGVGPAFDSGKTLGMLPFFVLGWALRERGLPRWADARSWTSLPVRAAAVAVLSGAVLVAYLYVGQVREWRLRKWAQMAINYADLGMPEWWAGFVRLAMLALAVALGAAVLLLVPRGRSRLTKWGQATMYVYMLHLFPLYLLRTTTDLFVWFDSVPRFCLLIGLAVVLTVVLSTRPVLRLFRPVVEPRLDWLLAPGPDSGRKVAA